MSITSMDKSSIRNGRDLLILFTLEMDTLLRHFHLFLTSAARKRRQMRSKPLEIKQAMAQGFVSEFGTLGGAAFAGMELAWCVEVVNSPELIADIMGVSSCAAGPSISWRWRKFRFTDSGGE